jgi:hypothetical protein
MKEAISATFIIKSLSRLYFDLLPLQLPTYLLTYLPTVPSHASVHTAFIFGL